MKMSKAFMFGTALFLTGYWMPVTANDQYLGVLPINSSPYGKSYGVWGQEFVNWVYQFSLEEFPLFQVDGDTDCSVAQNGKVWFLWGTLGGSVTRSCTIPPGKALFISVNSVVSFAPYFGDTEEEVREDASRDLDGTDMTTGVQTLEVVIDGVQVEDPFSYRASSPDGGFVFTIDEGTILEAFGIPAGDYEPAIVDGYWIMLRPLTPGEHTIQWVSSGQYQDGTSYSYNATWDITVGR